MTLYKLFSTMTIITVACISMAGQDHDIEVVEKSQMDYLEGEQRSVIGYFDHSVPAELFIAKKEDECSGLLRLGNSSELIKLEGACSDNSLEFYEYDEHARVSGLLFGSIKGQRVDLMWQSHNQERSYTFTGREHYTPDNRLKVFTVKNEMNFDHLLLWQDRENLNVSTEENLRLRWQNYYCQGALYACQYYDVHNEKNSLSISDRVVSAADRYFQYAEEIAIKNENDHHFEWFYNFSFPYIGDKEFDFYIDQIVQEQLSSFKNALPVYEESHPDNRFENRAIGDFYISLINENIISGFLMFNSTQHPRLKTVAFTFDRNKSRFFKLKDIWEKDFDFLYYLKTVIENKKRRVILKEDLLIRNILRDDPFTHFNFTTSGIIFFTDYNLIYGRRSINIPYSEIEGFIDNKSLSNLINNKI